MNKWDTLASDQIIEKTVQSLIANGMNALVIEKGDQAKRKVLEMLPHNAEVMTMTSFTLDTIGLTEAILNSTKHLSVRKQLMSLDPEKERKQMKKLGSVHEYVIGSVHAVTQEGQVLVASNSGSQLPAYSYGADHVIWVVGTQKIVQNVEAGIQRIYQHCLPLESERAKKAYGVAGSFVSKLLVFYKEPLPERATLIFVKEKLGY